MITTTLLQRLGLAALGIAVLSSYCMSVRAQTDPRNDARISALEARVNLDIQTLQNRMNKSEAAAVDLQAETRSERAKDRVQIDFLKNETVLLRAKVQQLTDEISALKARQPADPGKQPAPGKPADPANPADGQVLSLRAPFTVKDSAGKVIFKVDSASGNSPRAMIGNPTGARVEIGIGVGGASVVGLYDDANKILSTLVGDPKGSYLRVRDNEQSVSFGKVEGDGLGLFLRKDDKLFGEISAGKAGYGIVRVSGADGKTVGGLFASSEGGGLALTGPGGGKSAVSLGVTPTGGKVRVFPAAGGSARAELVADSDIGSVVVYNSDGSSAASVSSLASKGSKLEMTNANGQIVVQAGHQPSGRGMVNTGPFDGGIAGAMGGGLAPASSLVGRLKGK